MMKYEQWEQMSPEKKFQAARWESNAETNNATTKQDFKNIVKYLVTLIEKDECPSCQCKQVTPIKATNDELKDFIHESKRLTKADRQKTIIELLEKAKGLMELELEIDSYYASMDYSSMRVHESAKYETGIKATEEVIKNFRRL